MHTEETKRKISASISGEKNPFYGRKHSEETKKHWSKIRTGIKVSQETRKKISDKLKGRKRNITWMDKLQKARKEAGYESFREAHKNIVWKTGKDSHRWAGDNVKYRGLHTWVQKVLGTPDTCEYCGASGLSGHSIHWANKSGEYKRDENDWIRLCASCHGAYDKVTAETRIA